jgi:ATP-dependent protease Clp ATPase subunit
VSESPVFQLVDGRCSFCGRKRQIWSSGRDLGICAECLDLCREVMSGEPKLPPPQEDNGVSGAPQKKAKAERRAREKRVVSRCSFCARDQYQVRLVAGPGVFICDTCVSAIPT